MAQTCVSLGQGCNPFRNKTLRPFWAALISLVIVGCLTLQAIAGSGHVIGPFERAPYQWPFIDYPMYSFPRFEGDEIGRPLLIGIEPDSTEVEIEPDDLGLDFFPYIRGPVRAVRYGNREAAELFRVLYEERQGVRVIGFEIEERPIVITRTGYRSGPLKRVASMSFGPPGEPGANP